MVFWRRERCRRSEVWAQVDWGVEGSQPDLQGVLVEFHAYGGFVFRNQQVSEEKIDSRLLDEKG